MTRILVIDDEPGVRDFLATALARAGYEVAAAANGREGIHLCRCAGVDLVITDLVMPEKEGLETIVELRRDHPDLAVIAISGGARGSSRTYLSAAELCGADRVFDKPIAPATLLTAVREIVGPPADPGAQERPGPA
jgi:DNA-binding response OmpR family regulator